MTAAALLELDRVTRAYPAPPGAAPVIVLRELALRVTAGEAVAITGPSGSGKSTLLNLCGGLDRPTAGAVRLAGRDLAALTDRELAAVRNREVGFVFQLHHLLPQLSVLENVLLPAVPGGDLAAAETRAAALLERVGLAARQHHRPGELSGGECQRVAVVRALINQPRLLLADEPTGALDAAAAAAIADLLVEVNRRDRVTLVVVTHAGALARRLSRVLELRAGALVAP